MSSLDTCRKSSPWLHRHEMYVLTSAVFCKNMPVSHIASCSARSSRGQQGTLKQYPISDLSHGTSQGAIVQLQRQDAALLASRLCSGRRYSQRDATVAADAICVCVVFLGRTESPKIPKQSTTLLMSSKSRERRALPLFMCLENSH